MSKQRYSLFSLMLVVALVATCLGWFVARRQVEIHVKEIEALQDKHAELREETGQIEATDTDKIYVRNLKTAAFGVYRFRVALPADVKASLDCRFEVDGRPVKLNQPPISTDISGVVKESDHTHNVSELTIYLKRSLGSWTIGSGSDGFNLNCFSPIRDEKLLWLDNMRVGIALNEKATLNVLGNRVASESGAAGEGSGVGGSDITSVIAGLLEAESNGRSTGIQYDTQSFAKTEEIFLQEIRGVGENRDHVIRFVISPDTDRSGEAKKRKLGNAMDALMNRSQ